MRKKSGFTLLELMIASGVMIIALSGLIATYIGCLELVETTKNQGLALSAAQSMLEEIRSVPFTSVSGYNTTTFQVSGMTTNESRGYIRIDTVTANLSNISIGVCWRQKSSRIIGECQYSGGAITFVDSNSNGILDSPVQLSTLVTQR